MIHPDALALIKRFEGLRLKPYLCAAGVPTIGYGATLGVDGKPVTLEHPPFDEATAETLLERDVARFERGVDRLVRVPLAETQRGALVSFAFNLGLGALQVSTLLRRVNDREWDDVPAQFLRWTRARGHVLPGLMARRAAEVGLWCRHTSAAAVVCDAADLDLLVTAETGHTPDGAEADRVQISLRTTLVGANH